MRSTLQIKGAKLNKSQLAEFAASAISTEYASVNCLNITKKHTQTLFSVDNDISRRLKGTALNGGWVDIGFNIFKPKEPRTSNGKLVRYENLASGIRLIEVGHPDGVDLIKGITYVCEGLKKAIATAEQTRCRTFAFLGLSQGISLIDEINALQGDVRLILDNDNSITAIDTARSLVKKLRSGIKIALFRGFKGIDDAIAAGVKLETIPFIDAAQWSANWGGYQPGNKFVFSSPQFWDIPIPSDAFLVTIQGSKGTGKTWYMEQLAKRAKMIAFIFVITHRIALSRANSKRLGNPYIEDENYDGGSVGLCIDSILKIKLTDFVGATLFIDEICQVLDHLINSSTLKNKRAAIYQRFQEILQMIRETGGRIVVADADLDYKSVKLLKDLGGIPDEKCFTIQNTFEFKKGFAYYSNGTPIKAGSQSRFPVDVISKIGSEALAGKKLFIATSAQKRSSKYSTQTLEAYLISIGIPENVICRIDSETIGDLNHPAYKATERINEICERFQVILASPSLNTGVDITYKGLDFVFGIFTGILNCNGTRQFLGRIRDWSVPRIFYAPLDVHLSSDTVEITSFQDLLNFTTAHDSAIKALDLEWFEEVREQGKERLFQTTTEYYLAQTREKQCEKNEYLKRIVQGLMVEGYTIEFFESEIDVDVAAALYEELGQISDELVREEQLAKQEMPIISDEQAQALYNSTALPLEDKWQLEAHKIRKQLNLEPTVELQQKLADGYRSKLENNFAVTTGYEITKQLAQQSQYWAQEKSDVKEVTSDYVKRNIQLLRVEALKKVTFFEKIQEEFGQVEAAALIEDLMVDPNNRKLFSLSDDGGTYAVKKVKAIAESFGFEVKQSRKTAKERFYKATNQAFQLYNQLGSPEGESKNVKPHIFEYWLDIRGKRVANWQDFKNDFRKIKRGALLDELKSLPKLTDEFKYAKLATRAKTLPLPEMPTYKWVIAENANDFTTWLKAKSEIAIDIETYGEGNKGGLNHLTGHIRLIQFSCMDAIWLLEQSDFGLVRESIRNLLLNQAQRKIGHNFMFDLRFLKKEFGVIARNCADTMLGSRCLLGDLGAAKITNHSLKSAALNFLGIEMDKNEQKSDWSDTLTTSQIDYSASDTWITFVLYKRLEELCRDPSKLLLPFPKMMAWEAWELENKFLFAAQMMEATGYEIDVPALNEAITKYTSVRDSLLAKWDLPCAPTQKAQIKKYLSEKYKISLKSINKASAANHTDIPEILLMQQICACNALLLQLAAIEKQVAVNSGRVTTVFKTLSGTGRTATGATGIDKMLINLQSLAARVNPALKGFDLSKLKGVFKTNLIIDLPASHGRISAELSNDEQHLKGYLDTSIDMHCVTAAAVSEAVFPGMGYTAEWIQANKDTNPIAKGLRDTAKNTYYGWLNGAGASRIQEQIKSNLQIDANFNACKKALEGLQTVFAATTEFGKEKLKELEANQFIINGIICGWLEVAGTYLCWKLGEVGGNFRIPATKAFACLWSRTESLLMKRSCIRIAEKFETMPEWGAKLQNFIHDEVNCEIGHPDAAEFAHNVVREEFGRICSRTVVGFDPLKKCYPLQNWGQK